MEKQIINFSIDHAGHIHNLLSDVSDVKSAIFDPKAVKPVPEK